MTIHVYKQSTTVVLSFQRMCTMPNAYINYDCSWYVRNHQDNHIVLQQDWLAPKKVQSTSNLHPCLLRPHNSIGAYIKMSLVTEVHHSQTTLCYIGLRVWQLKRTVQTIRTFQHMPKSSGYVLCCAVVMGYGQDGKVGRGEQAERAKRGREGEGRKGRAEDERGQRKDREQKYRWSARGRTEGEEKERG